MSSFENNAMPAHRNEALRNAVLLVKDGHDHETGRHPKADSVGGEDLDWFGLPIAST